MAKMLELVQENADYQNFLFFPQSFKRPSSNIHQNFETNKLKKINALPYIPGF